MPSLTIDGTAVLVRSEHEILRVEPWGPDSFRVRAARRRIRDDLEHALVTPRSSEATITRTNERAEIVNGRATVVIDTAIIRDSSDVHLRFSRTGTDDVVLTEERAHFWWPGARSLEDDGSGAGRVEQRFCAYPDEKFFGLGQHTHGRLDQKGLVVDLVQRNAEISIPFTVSSRGYGFLWNSPALGRVELTDSGTRWVADSARQLDYWITIADEPSQIMSAYADATGHAPVLPRWATGFWQSKLRYMSQDELMEVAREYKRRDLPISVIVIDYFHWTRLGDWKFDPQA